MNRFGRISGMSMAVLELVRIGLGLAGFFLLMVHGSRAYEAYSSQFWPMTTGEITRSAVDASGDNEGNRRYYSRIKYRYAVEPPADDGAYLNSQRVRIQPIPPVDSRAIAEARVEPYPKGANVAVYYNPNRPERSLLEPDFSLGYLLWPLMGLLCLAAAISLWQVGR